jgi:hypothetical protein
MKNINSFISKKIILFLFYIVNYVYSLQKNEIQNFGLSLINPINNQYSLSMLNFTPKQFTQQLMSLDYVKSENININNIISKYNLEIKRELSTFIGNIKSFIKTPENGLDLLEKIVDNFNYNSRNFSRQVERLCLELIFDSKSKGIFEEYVHIDTIDKTKEKMEDIGDQIKKSNDNIQKGIFGSAAGAAFSFINQDPIATVSYMTSTVTYLYDFVKDSPSCNFNKKSNNENSNLISQNEIVLTKSERLELESKIFIFSQLYCSMGYNLQIHLKDNLIQLIGDKVSYISMINLITTLQQNIELHLIKLTSEPLNEKNKYTMLSLKSLSQRLGVLKIITDYLYNIINFSFEIQIIKMSTYPSGKTLHEFESFLISQLNELNKLIIKLQMIFPFSKEEKEKQSNIIEADIEIQSIYLDILDLIQNATEIAKHRSAIRFAQQNVAWWRATKTIGESFMEIGLNSTYFVKNNINKFIIIFIELAGDVPFHLFNYIINFFNKILYLLLINPAGWLLFIIGILLLEIPFGGISNFFILIKKILNLFVIIIKYTFLSIYKLFYLEDNSKNLLN